jgi:hypothetical protein
MKEFGFYLDAWCYCNQHKIDPAKIKRRDWATWTVK